MNRVFKVGDRVRLSDHAKEHFIDSQNPRDGVITRISKKHPRVYVKKDGNKSSGSYHSTFWELIPNKRKPFTSVVCNITDSGTETAT